MRLFDKVLGAPSGELDAREAFAALAFCAVSADGLVTEDEAASLGATLGRMRLYADVPPRHMNRAFEKITRLVREEGAATVVARAAAAIPADLRATAFAVAVDLAMADRDIADSERALLERMREALGVPRDEAARIVAVLEIKNRG